MALFGKLFEKKSCDLCGEDIGLLGNRKLEDGNCCKKCAAKLSPYFDGRRHSTVEEIRGQLAYREENQQNINQFHATRILGKDTKVYIDENSGRFFVTGMSDYKSENPDIIDVTKITNCDYTIDESHYELTETVEDSDGDSSEVSYSPKRYHYTYNFKMTIHVDHPYFNEIRFDVNGPGIGIDTVGLIGSGNARKLDSPTATNGGGIFGLAMDILDILADSEDPRQQTPEYVEYNKLADEIKDTLNSLRDRFIRGEVPATTEPAEEAPQITQAPAQQRPKFCTNCGAQVASSTGSFCEYCGTKLF